MLIKTNIERNVKQIKTTLEEQQTRIISHAICCILPRFEFTRNNCVLQLHQNAGLLPKEMTQAGQEGKGGKEASKNILELKDKSCWTPGLDGKVITAYQFNQENFLYRISSAEGSKSCHRSPVTLWLSASVNNCRVPQKRSLRVDAVVTH